MLRSRNWTATTWALKAPTSLCSPKCRKCKTHSRSSRIRKETSKTSLTSKWLSWRTKSKSKMISLSKMCKSSQLLKNSWRNLKIKQKLCRAKSKYLEQLHNFTILATTRKSASSSKMTCYYPSKKDQNWNKKFWTKMKNGLTCMRKLWLICVQESKNQTRSDLF